ncbi:hypothetical protein [Maribacter luteus]|uniref:DUF5018 domain-containing protein n=1 Tax=Maribacter luteus TaxID=2594478 RepID=A0A6I2MNX0_9FLAO|nr:hypothetical protein [Maribacter luteus]MRX65543.1 hypothetical protein [Maribacter luteus]
MKTIILFWKRTYKTNVFIYCLLVLLMAGCSKDDAPATQEIIKSAENELISFTFLASQNTDIETDVSANINITSNTITVNLPSDTPVTALTPSIIVSPKATINPKGIQDFTDAVTYTVTAEDGTTRSYSISTSSKSSAKQITSFVFLLTNNPIDVNVVATIDEENKTITAAMPPSTDLSGLLPEVQLSELATIDLTAAQNFTGPLEYTVTAEDGSTTVYNVTITALLTQRQILQAILDTNPGNTLSWNLQNTADLDALNGVTTNTEGKIIKLRLDANLISIPPEIGQLIDLEDLNIAENQLTSIPKEIGQLTNLTRLHLGDNLLTAIPAEIGQLIDLSSLVLNQNELTELPPELAQLTNLKDLGLGDNQFTSVPPEIWKLIGLVSLDLSKNQLTSLPKEIGLLTNLAWLTLRDNQLSELPPEIGFLINLEILNIVRNNLRTIPIAILNLLTWNNTSMELSLDAGIELGNSQKDALISIYSANPGNTLGWGVDNFPEVSFHSNGDIKGITMNNKKLTRIPENISALSRLENFNVNSNNLDNLPAELGAISSLVVITAASNQLNTVAPELGQLNNLALLSITNNPMTSIPQEVCDLQISNGGILTILTDTGEGCN